tara:strand:+ start:830 stop:1111 length:282 start_codon:yes stop_codon:yes gene_type:complete
MVNDPVYSKIDTPDGVVFIEEQHSGQSMTNAIERVMCKEKVKEVVYFSESDQIWNKAVMKGNGVVFDTPEKTHSCYTIKRPHWWGAGKEVTYE